MAEMRQSQGERNALRAVWEAQPEVVAFHAALLAHAKQHQLGFDAAGMSALAAFGHAWRQEHGIIALPESGILVG
jgi:hypothetical protein